MKISALIPAYNAAAYVAMALESALNQTRPPDEIIVVDDGSTDGTAEIASSYPGRVIRQVNGGISAARNRCVAEARHELIAWLDADDIWLPYHLQRLEQLLEHHVIAFGDGATLFPDGPEPETYVDRSDLRQRFAISDSQPTVIERSVQIPDFRSVYPTWHDAGQAQ